MVAVEQNRRPLLLQADRASRFKKNLSPDGFTREAQGHYDALCTRLTAQRCVTSQEQALEIIINAGCRHDVMLFIFMQQTMRTVFESNTIARHSGHVRRARPA